MDSDLGSDYAGLVAARAPALLRLAVMLTGTRVDAEDLLQSTLLQGHRHQARICAMAAPAAYLRRVMINVHLSDGRRARRRPRVVALSTEAPPTVGAEAGPGERWELHEEVWGWLATLPRQQRAVLVLRFYEDLDDPEIAEILGCSPGTVRAHASKALAALRTRVGDRPVEDTREPTEPQPERVHEEQQP